MAITVLPAPVGAGESDGRLVLIQLVVATGLRQGDEDLLDRALLIVLQRELHRAPPSTLMV